MTGSGVVRGVGAVVTIEGGSRSRAADDVALERLFAREYPGMVRLAFLLTGSRPAAEDLTHDAFIKIHARLASIDRPGAYLHTTLVNLCHSYVRRERVERRLRPFSRPPVVEPTGDNLFDALNTLSAKQRAAVVLRYYEDLSDDDIAARLDVRPATVRSLIHRGLARLQEVIER